MYIGHKIHLVERVDTGLIPKYGNDALEKKKIYQMHKILMHTRIPYKNLKNGATNFFIK